MTRAIIDAHQHFWDPRRYNYPWMKNAKLEPLRRAFLPNDLVPILKDVGVQQTILVQAQSSLDETNWFLELARANDFIAGVVGWVDLTSSDLPETLDYLVQDPKFKGVRHQLEEETDDAWLIRQDVLRGLKELERRGLPYDLLVKPKHLKYVPTAARHAPELRMVIDHIAKPFISSKEWQPWAEAIAAVAKIPNIWCKLSGMITEADWKDWRLTDFKPFINHVIEHFGFNRVMFGSDWPVCILAGAYAQTVEIVERNMGDIPVSQRDRIFRENARTFYRLF